ncbi:hypothetical protein [Streptodolium elevatio]|uniref:Uncharacterized protein n=1 Tax=Streptodolium elevatio TaxID=3157996 RepID=A0ABV3DD32_9ACTN
MQRTRGDRPEFRTLVNSRDAADSPVFWYFLDYGVERPSAFAGIRHWKTKNHGFAVIDDFENWDDPKFHATVLTEFAAWWIAFHTGRRT